MHRSVHECTGLHRSAQECTGMHRSVQECTRLYNSVQEMYRSAQECTGVHRTALLLHEKTPVFRSSCTKICCFCPKMRFFALKCAVFEDLLFLH